MTPRFPRFAAALLAVSVAAPGWLFAAGAMEPASRKEAPSEYKAGLVTREIHPPDNRNWRGSAVHVLHATIWYPAPDTVTETMQTASVALVPGMPIFEAGLAAPHAPFAPALDRWPLVLLSHGSGGSAAMIGWLGTALARAGFVVAAVDHPGNNADEPMTAAGFALPWERATDLSDTLDALLKDPELGSHIDPNRVGAAGFSIGGYTVLELAGARTDLTQFTDMCRQRPETLVCGLPGARGFGSVDQLLREVRQTSGESLARSGDSFRDPRIRAVFAIAPAPGSALTSESLRSIRVPVEEVVGSADPIAPAADNADFIRAFTHGARETVLPGVTHYTFLDRCTAAGLQAVPQYCADPAGVNRAAVHAQVAAMAAEFFTHALRPH